MDLFRIDRETCNHCGLCVEVCAGDFVRMDEEGYPAQSDDAEEICIRCGHCVTVCPSGSFSLREMPQQSCPPVRRELSLTPEHCEHFLRYRRAIRLDKDLALWEGGADIIFQGAPAVVITHARKDEYTARETCTVALTYMELAATSLKLGCCWAGYFEKAATYFPPMKKALALPEGHECFGAMMVGHPRYTHHRLPTRKPPKITWHL